MSSDRKASIILLVFCLLWGWQTAMLPTATLKGTPDPNVGLCCRNIHRPVPHFAADGEKAAGCDFNFGWNGRGPIRNF